MGWRALGWTGLYPPARGGSVAGAARRADAARARVLVGLLQGAWLRRHGHARRSVRLDRAVQARERPFGIDIIYFFHRYLAIIALGLVLAHFAILWFRYEEALGPLDPREARWELTAGRAALVMFVLAVVTSEWIEYGWWRLSHVAFATIGFGAAIAHIVGIGYYTDAPGKRTLWLATTRSWVLVVVWARIVKPWRQKLRPYRVAEVRSELGQAWTLALEPDGPPGLRRFKPGQFAWLTLRRSPFSLRGHPFSIASPPEKLPRIEFGIKELGDFTSTIGEVKPGEVAYLDAPYGVFSVDSNPDAPGFVGIGVTPIISMLRSMAERGDRRPVCLFYGNTNWGDVIYREELDAVRQRLDLRLVHILEQPPDDWRGERGYVTKELLERHLAPEQRTALHYFLCGPTPMTRAAADALHDLGVPPSRVQTEIFELV